MTGRVRAAALAVVFLFGASVSAAAAVLSGGEGEVAGGAMAVAEDVADDMAAERFDDVAERVHPDAAAALSAATLRSAWDQITTQVGAFRSRDDGQARPAGIVAVPLRFQRGVVDLEVTLDARSRVLGLYLRDRYVPGTGSPAAPGDAAVAVAEGIADALAAGDWRRAAERFSPTMRAAVPEVELEVVWREVLAAGGPFQRRLPPEVYARPPHRVVVVPLAFQARVAELRVTVADGGEVVGLFLVPSVRTASPRPG